MTQQVLEEKQEKMSKCCPSCEFMWLKTFPAPTRPVRAVSNEDNSSPPAGIYGRRVAAGFCTHTLELPGDVVGPPPKLVCFRTPGALIVITGVSPSHPSIPFFAQKAINLYCHIFFELLKQCKQCERWNQCSVTGVNSF